jgi:hypothetical protein
MAGLTLSVDWEALGAEAASSFDGASALVVMGTDPSAVARVALGIGRMQSRSRRVAIGDLIGEVEPLQRLITGDDPHGIVDSFLYGVSLNKIARQVDDGGMLFVMPSGTEPIVTSEIIQNERWRRLAAGFKEVGALLLLVVRSDAEGIAELAKNVEGVVVVGDATTALSVPRDLVRAFIEAPAPVFIPVSSQSSQYVEDRPAPAPARPTPVMLPKQSDDVAPRSFNPFTTPGPQRNRLFMLAGAVALASLWFLLGRPGWPKGGPSVKPPVATSALNVPGDTTSPPDVIDRPTAAASAATDSLSATVPANPQDSSKAAAYGVVIVATNDEAQALARWADLGLNLPAGTVTMVRIRGERGRFFQMQAGAFGKARQADSLLASLRASGKLKSDAGRVVATPYALMLETKVSRRAAQNVADGYGQRQIAAYALLQADGSATIYVGAFESPDQVGPLMNELKAKGVSSTLYYRTGRSF